MMSSFFEVLVAVLNGDVDIPELPQTDLLPSSILGTPLNREISSESRLKIARLQTLIEREKTKYLPTAEDIQTFIDSSDTGLSVEVGVEEAEQLKFDMDYNERVAMLNRLIVEIVRTEVPTEVDRMGVVYFVGHFDVMWSPE